MHWRRKILKESECAKKRKQLPTRSTQLLQVPGKSKHPSQSTHQQLSSLPPFQLPHRPSIFTQHNTHHLHAASLAVRRHCATSYLQLASQAASCESFTAVAAAAASANCAVLPDVRKRASPPRHSHTQRHRPQRNRSNHPDAAKRECEGMGEHDVSEGVGAE